MSSPRSRLRTVLRWSSRIALGVVALVAVVAGSGYALSERRMRARFAVPEHPLAVHDDAATVARGQHLATVRGCTDCHGDGLRGNVMIDDPLVGRLAAPNLTAGRRGAALTPADWERAVRHAVRRDGSPLLLMPAHEFHIITDEDLGAVVAFARTLPADTTVPPASRAGPLVRALHLADRMVLLPAEKIDHAAPHTARVAEAPDATYGKYVAAGCVGCHNANLTGGPIAGAPPGWKPAANLTPAGIGRWSRDDFVRAMRTGRRPDGTPIDSAMPIRMTRQMTDVELHAVYAYLRTVPARPYAAR